MAQDTKSRLRSGMRDLNPLVALLVLCFAFSSWIDLYGVYVEVPILVHVLPEGWTFPSYLIVLIECAMITPVCYGVINKLFPGNQKRREVIIAYIIMSVGLTALILLTIFWDVTVHVAGGERSLAALLLIFFLAMVDTTSCVVYLPYMARFKEQYMPAYVAGEDAGGLITGVVGLIQGAGGEMSCFNQTTTYINETTGEAFNETKLQVSIKQPRFPVSGFFVFLACMMIVSMSSFSLLNFAPFAKREMIEPKDKPKDPHVDEEQNSENIKMLPQSPDSQDPKNGTIIQNGLDGLDALNTNEGIIQNPKADENEDIRVFTQDPTTTTPFTRRELITVLLIYVAGSTIVYGLFPTILSYSCLPFGALTYTLAVQIYCCVNPLAALTAYVVRTKSLLLLGIFMGISIILVAFHFYLASASPNPPLKDHPAGKVIVVITVVVAAAIFSYDRSCLVTLLHIKGGHKGLVYAGIAVQVGAFTGGITGFLLVTVFKVFDSIPLCGDA